MKDTFCSSPSCNNQFISWFDLPSCRQANRQNTRSEANRLLQLQYLTWLESIEIVLNVKLDYLIYEFLINPIDQMPKSYGS